MSKKQAAEGFRGARIDPGDRRYPALVRGFNQRWVGRPRSVAVCGDAPQVIAAVQQALDDGQRITCRGGGHCYEDFVSGNDGGVILDLTPLAGVGFDPASGCFAVGGGATLWNVYEALFKQYGVTLPGGSCYSVGAGGHVTGGGYGLLSRLHGLIVDYLDAVELVVVDEDRRARLIRVGRDSANPDERALFWAHQGGGGGNFGIVTRFFFRDPPAAPAEAWLASLAWEWSDLDEGSFARLVRRYGRFFERHSGVDSPYGSLFALLHLTQRAAGQVVVTVQQVVPEEAGEEPQQMRELLAELADGLPEAVPQRVPVGYHHFVGHTTEIQRMPWLDVTQTLNPSGPNRRGKYKSAYMKAAFPERQIPVLWHHLSGADGFSNPAALLQVDSYGCRINAVAPDATAVAQRSSILKLQYQTYWDHRRDDGVNLDWIRAFYVDMYGERGPWPDGVFDGCYVNYPDVDLEDWPMLYYKDNYPRLLEVKRRWDPNDVFHHRQSIGS